MKQKDIAVIAITVFIAAIFSYLICSNFLFTTKDRQQKVEVVSAIDSSFSLPDKSIFNSDAIDPTKLITIGPNTNNQPFTN